ncbi:MAG: hypothetical protein SGPRY_000790, partial [Prymnesium sp.]
TPWLRAMLFSLPEEVLRCVLVYLSARDVAAAAQSSSLLRRLSYSAAETRMELLGSTWPTLLPGETPASALSVIESLQAAGRLWRYLLTPSERSELLLLHHRPSGITLHLDERFSIEVTSSIGEDVVRTMHIPDLSREELFGLRRASSEAKACHLRAAAGSPVELLVRKAALGKAVDVPWTEPRQD